MKRFLHATTGTLLLLALLLSPAERRDRTEMALRELGGIAGWRRFGQTAVAVQCSSLRQTRRVDGA